MAATWTMKITVIDLATKHMIAVGTRTDGADVWSDKVETWVNTSAAVAKQTIANDLHALYLAYKAKQDAIAAQVGTWEADISTLLNGMEV